MRGEHCIAGASVLTFISIILLVFANIGQLSSGPVTKGVYMVEVNLVAFGNAVQKATANANGLYNTNNTPMGQSKGLRQIYRYGLYSACGYQKDMSGTCNSSKIAYEFEPMGQMLADTPPTLKQQTYDLLGKDAKSFKDDGWNYGLSKTGSALIFTGSILCGIAFICGLVKHRFSFLFAAASSGVSAFLLMVGAAMWTSIIAKDSWLKAVNVTVKGNAKQQVPLGIYVNAGPSLYLTWVSFVLITLSVFPYVISCCTYRK